MTPRFFSGLPLGGSVVGWTSPAEGLKQHTAAELLVIIHEALSFAEDLLLDQGKHSVLSHILCERADLVMLLQWPDLSAFQRESQPIGKMIAKRGRYVERQVLREYAVIHGHQHLLEELDIDDDGSCMISLDMQVAKENVAAKYHLPACSGNVALQNHHIVANYAP